MFTLSYCRSSPASHSNSSLPPQIRYLLLSSSWRSQMDPILVFKPYTGFPKYTFSNSIRFFAPPITFSFRPTLITYYINGLIIICTSKDSSSTRFKLELKWQFPEYSVRVESANEILKSFNKLLQSRSWVRREWEATGQWTNLTQSKRRYYQ